MDFSVIVSSFSPFREKLLVNFSYIFLIQSGSVFLFHISLGHLPWSFFFLRLVLHLFKTSGQGLVFKQFFCYRNFLICVTCICFSVVILWVCECVCACVFRNLLSSCGNQCVTYRTSSFPYIIYVSEVSNSVY